MYNNFQGEFGPQQYDPRMRPKGIGLRKDASYAGVLTLSIIITSFLFSFLLQLVFTFSGLIKVNSEGAMAYSSTLSYWAFRILVYVLPFVLSGLVITALFDKDIKPFSQIADNGGRSEKLSVSSGVLIILAGVGLCMVSNFITNIFLSIFEGAGGSVPDLDKVMGVRPGIYNYIFDVISTALLPAFLEEMIWRGYTERALLPYGNGLAVVVSAVLFSLMHGNIVQIPFAFMVGIVLAVITYKTKNVGYAVAIHFLNNFLSVTIQHLGFGISDIADRNLFSGGVIMIIMLVGIISLIVLALKRDPALTNTYNPAYEYNRGTRARELFSSPGLWIGVIALFVYTIYSSIMLMR